MSAFKGILIVAGAAAAVATVAAIVHARNDHTPPPTGPPRAGERWLLHGTIRSKRPLPPGNQTLMIESLFESPERSLSNMRENKPAANIDDFSAIVNYNSDEPTSRQPIATGTLQVDNDTIVEILSFQRLV